MAYSFINNEPEVGKITVRLEYSADSAKAQEIMSNVAEWRHSNGDGPVDGNEDQIAFASLSNQQKLDIVGDYIKQRAKDWSENWATDVAIAAISIDPTDHEFDEE